MQYFHFEYWPTVTNHNNYSLAVCEDHCIISVYRPFQAKMNELLKKMLKLDPKERMTFSQFFNTVDDIIPSKIEIVNLLHGTSHKIISDPDLT